MVGVEFRDVEKCFDEAGKAGGSRRGKMKQRVQALEKFNLSIQPGEFMVLVGPSGCGKSTALRLLAGLESPDQGDILIDGLSVIHKEPQQRDVAMVFQNYALYPHMTVEQNLSFPLKMRKQTPAQIKTKVHEVAEILDLSELLQRKPKQLSGGQRQRVAMGRALVREPKVFLMDEPLSNLDAKLRVQIRSEIAALQQRMGVTTIYVTHDQAEAMTLGQRVAVLKKGQLQQVDLPQRLYQEPANRFVAQFIGSPGMNVFPVSLQKTEQGMALKLGEQTLAVPPQCLPPMPDLIDCSDQTVLLGLRPEALTIARSDEARPNIKVMIQAVEALGHETLVYFQINGLADQYVLRTHTQEEFRPQSLLTVIPDFGQAYFFSQQGNRLA